MLFIIIIIILWLLLLFCDKSGLMVHSKYSKNLGILIWQKTSYMYVWVEEVIMKCGK